ncbi:hypothetical protein HOE67_03030 [Candidatus Peregrinibacteria bacterium]|nr:hypothetical protein [Candidatus Peregrinibacteria bacterium]MBT4056059.1 hypothetical protein [Candidatus Peregrinibacteria bacterium]
MARKFWHVVTMLFIIFGYFFLVETYSKEVGLFAVYGLLLAFMLFEGIRLSYVPYITKLVGILLRKHEYEKPSSPINFLAAFIIVFSLVEPIVALAAMLMLVFGDMMAAVIGVLFGETKLFGKKTYVGTLAGLAANLIVGFVVLADRPVLFIAMAIVATAVELFTNKLDDNLTIPLTTAFVGQIIF